MLDLSEGTSWESFSNVNRGVASDRMTDMGAGVGTCAETMKSPLHTSMRAESDGNAQASGAK